MMLKALMDQQKKQHILPLILDLKRPTQTIITLGINFIYNRVIGRKLLKCENVENKFKTNTDDDAIITKNILRLL